MSHHFSSRFGPCRSPGETEDLRRLDRPLAEAGAPDLPPSQETRLTVLEGMYTAAAGMAAQQTRLDAVSADLANVDTTGYKSRACRVPRSRVRQRPGLRRRQGRRASAPGSPRPPSAASSAQGALQDTGRSLDVALNGPGYLQVKLDDGTQGADARRQPPGRRPTAASPCTPASSSSRPIKVPQGANPDAVEDRRRRHGLAGRQGARPAQDRRCPRSGGPQGRPGQHLRGDQGLAARSAPRPSPPR